LSSLVITSCADVSVDASNWDSSLSDILARLDLDAVDRTLFAAGCRLRLTLFTGTFSTASTSSLAALTFSRFVLLVCFRLLTGDCLLVGLLTCLLACLLVCLLGCLLLDLPLCERAGDTTGGLRFAGEDFLEVSLFFPLGTLAVLVSLCFAGELLGDFRLLLFSFCSTLTRTGNEAVFDLYFFVLGALGAVIDTGDSSSLTNSNTLSFRLPLRDFSGESVFPFPSEARITCNGLGFKEALKGEFKLLSLDFIEKIFSTSLLAFFSC
jgi:hypothetical protein